MNTSSIRETNDLAKEKLITPTENQNNIQHKKNFPYLVRMMLQGNITLPSSHIPNFDLSVSASTGNDIPAFVSFSH